MHALTIYLIIFLSSLFPAVSSNRPLEPFLELEAMKMTQAVLIDTTQPDQAIVEEVARTIGDFPWLIRLDPRADGTQQNRFEVILRLLAIELGRSLSVEGAFRGGESTKVFLSTVEPLSEIKPKTTSDSSQSRDALSSEMTRETLSTFPVAQSLQQDQLIEEGEKHRGSTTFKASLPPHDIENKSTPDHFPTLCEEPKDNTHDSFFFVDDFVPPDVLLLTMAGFGSLLSKVLIPFKNAPFLPEFHSAQKPLAKGVEISKDLITLQKTPTSAFENFDEIFETLTGVLKKMLLGLKTFPEAVFFVALMMTFHQSFTNGRLVKSRVPIS